MSIFDKSLPPCSQRRLPQNSIHSRHLLLQLVDPPPPSVEEPTVHRPPVVWRQRRVEEPARPNKQTRRRRQMQVETEDSSPVDAKTAHKPDVPTARDLSKAKSELSNLSEETTLSNPTQPNTYSAAISGIFPVKTAGGQLNKVNPAGIHPSLKETISPRSLPLPCKS